MDARVSVILPVYNQAHYLPEALDGVFAQTYPHYELIVVNDGSTDGTDRVLADYQQRYDFTVITQENRGLPRALNTGFARARGEYLTWTSSDNVMLPEMLTVLVQALDEDPSVGLVYADRYLMDDAGQDLGRFDLPDYDPYLLLHVNIVHCCFLYRRECMERVSDYAPDFIYGEDWEYWIRISQYYRMKHVSRALYRYRLHGDSMTSELVRGTANNMGYPEFAARMRRRMPFRWYMGKLKWWWLRVSRKNHPAITERVRWQRAAAKAAQTATFQVDRRSI
jgi:glycosyltransferase involved in cell wall biosynthesis